MICLTPALADAATKSMVIEWGYPDPVPTDLAGFNIYMDGTKIATISAPTARTYTGALEYRDESVCYTMTAFDTGGQSPRILRVMISTCSRTLQ